jgi:hypothetical protein
MGSIWKDLLFLQGHFTRPEDLLDDAYDQAAKAAAQRETRTRTEALADTDGLACGGCH